MNIKGLDPIRKHVPDLNTPQGVLRLFLLSMGRPTANIASAYPHSGRAWVIYGDSSDF
jgi:hypothetical protein